MFHARPLQLSFEELEREPIQLDCRISFSEDFRISGMVVKGRELQVGKPWREENTLSMVTDGKFWGWGDQVKDLLFQGTWGEESKGCLQITES
ncbi:hypothetical protein GDO81_025883 [Engystomops pustulosus]|uniref:Galectin n=1 Tax=Engystomops pustulosus TaxID=76066 RepID=A0AAV6ZVU1_ENGPU|nr:hypothetical protein GDO81_025883 [Engystomops pustulosus]